MSTRRARLRPWSRLVLSLAALLAVAACSNGVAPDEDSPPALAPQASGSFSGGSLLRGSVEGKFTGVGLGNTEHQLTMNVNGVLWYECINNGGNYAPGQFAFDFDDTTFLEPGDEITRNGMFRKHDPLVAGDGLPADFVPCKTNWTINTYPDDYRDVAKRGQPILFLQVVKPDGAPGDVTAELREKDSGLLADTFKWTCTDPGPTMPLISFIEGLGEDSLSEVCTLVDGPR